MSDTGTQKTGKMSRRLKVLLFVSIALNLLVMGLVAGAMLRKDRDLGGPHTRSQAIQVFGIGPFGAALAPKDRQAIGEALESREAVLQKNRDEVRQATVAFLRALGADPFDGVQFRAALEALNGLLSNRQDIVLDVFVARVEAMNADERRQFLKRLERSLKRDFRRK